MFTVRPTSIKKCCVKNSLDKELCKLAIWLSVSPVHQDSTATLWERITNGFVVITMTRRSAVPARAIWVITDSCRKTISFGSQVHSPSTACGVFRAYHGGLMKN